MASPPHNYASALDHYLIEDEDQEDIVEDLRERSDVNDYYYYEKINELNKTEKATLSQPFNVIKNKYAFNKLTESFHDYNEKNDKKDTFASHLAKKKKKQNIERRKKKSLPTKHPELEARTIFVGNISINTKRKTVKKFFTQYGPVETVRFRGIRPKTPNVNKKQALIKNLMDPNQKSIVAYVRFRAEDSKKKALKANGEKLEGLRIRVDVSSKSGYNKHSIFVGNLSWGVTEAELESFFCNCGVISDVKVLRNASSGKGKGAAFISFESEQSVEIALNLNGKEFQKRPLRVQKLENKRRLAKMKAELEEEDDDDDDDDENQRRRKKGGKVPRKRANGRGPTKRSVNFSGYKVNENGKPLKQKSRRKTKAELKKIVLAKKLGAR